MRALVKREKVNEQGKSGERAFHSVRSIQSSAIALLFFIAASPFITAAAHNIGRPRPALTSGPLKRTDNWSSDACRRTRRRHSTTVPTRLIILRVEMPLIRGRSTKLTIRQRMSLKYFNDSFCASAHILNNNLLNAGEAISPRSTEKGTFSFRGIIINI